MLFCWQFSNIFYFANECNFIEKGMHLKYLKINETLLCRQQKQTGTKERFRVVGRKWRFSTAFGLFSLSKVLHIWCSTSQLPEQCWQFMNCHPRIYWISIWQMYLLFFFLPPVFSFCCDNAVLMFWLYWGTRTSWFGLGKDHIFASCYSGNCPNILLKPYGSRLLIVLAKISSDVATASSFKLPIHAKMFVSNCTTVMPTYFCVLHVCMAVKQYNNKRPLLRVELVSRPPVLLRCLVPDQSPLSSCAVSVCLCAWPM